MKDQHSHQHTCTHCNCNNPLLTTLKDELFSKENLSALPTANAFVKEEPSQTLMITGGTIRPMINGEVKPVDAIGIAGGNVVVTGDEKHVKEFMDRHHPHFSHKILKDGHTLLPGLIEPHVHIVPTSLMMSWLDINPFDGQDLREQYDFDWLTSTISDGIKSLKKGQWLLGNGVDPALMPLIDNNKELQTINAASLDKIDSVTPIMLMSASMHTLYLNSPALNVVYNMLYKENKDRFDEKYPNFEDYLNANQGQLQELAGMGPAFKCIPKEQIAIMVLESFKHLEQFFQTANERGVTFMYDAGMDNGLKALLEVYLAVHNRVVRIGAAQICTKVDDVKALGTYTAPTEYKDVYIGSVKVVSDGSNQGLTGYQSDSYLCQPTPNYGVFNFGKPTDPSQKPSGDIPKDYDDLMRTVIAEEGWPLMVHANGNLAVTFAIEMYQKYIPKQKVQGVRHRIEHCSLLTQDQLDTMKELGVSPSFLIGHVGYWGYAFKEAIFGKEKTQMLDLCKSALKRDMRITLHSDYGVSPLGPLRMMEQSITRIMEADAGQHVLHPEERITVEEALKAVTYDAAWQCNAEQWTGSLKTGNFADFIILKEDPITIKQPYMRMRNIKVLETWVGGLPVYARAHSEMSMA